MDLQNKIGIFFKDPHLLELALTHSSYLNEKPGLARDSNERLEFLGDAVLGLIITEKLYHDLSESAEGELTRLRSALVRRETLAEIARIIGLGEYLHMGKGEDLGGGREKPLNLAGAFEALVAAIYLDQGISVARQFVLKLYGNSLYKQANKESKTDYKSRLQEIIQAKYQVAPSYYVIQATGPDHDREFIVEVRVGEKALGYGSGKSKKLAEMEAAHSVLKSLKIK